MQIIYLTSGIAIIHVNSISIINVMIANLVLKKNPKSHCWTRRDSCLLPLLADCFYFLLLLSNFLDKVCAYDSSSGLLVNTKSYLSPRLQKHFGKHVVLW